MKLQNVLRKLQQHVNQKMHKTQYICVRSWEAYDIINDWKADEATDYVVLIDYQDGDEDLSISDLWDRV